VNARLRVVIADDERPARSFLAALLRSFEDVLIVAEAASGKEALAAIERERPDLALLDLQMPELDGIGVVRMLKKRDMPLIAFVTAYDEYAVRAFEVNAVDYLLKPVEKTRLREALNRAQERIEHAEIVAEQSVHVSDAIAAYAARHHLPAQGSRSAARSVALHPPRTRHARQHRPDHESERDAWRHARRSALQRTEAPGQPAAVSDHPRALPEALTAVAEPGHM
jgi:YesN/AraC family two-component response regulator